MICNRDMIFFFHADFCTAGINDCDINAECKNISSAPFFECSCLPGYVGNGSVCKGKMHTNSNSCSFIVQESSCACMLCIFYHNLS